ncbi:Inner membrane transport protein YdhP [Methylocella tundrae]|uniref:Inner membrane transport protein YdhP n=1 Tax=Methylocella tundrae TaxID=227605 RepID=A0A8B6MBW8_METTU|nr:MFS transporter [Methylocella tundrae]VTZ52537.1 Inner membrane transport protein YdhP [Methylocella tundrae]
MSAHFRGRTPAAPSRTALVEFSLAVGGFGIGAGEFAIMGLLPNVAGGVGVSTPTAGHVISAYALGVVVGAPIITVLFARLPRRTLLLALMAVFALGNFASASAPGYASLMALRFMTGLPHGAYFGVAALVAAEMAGPGKRAQAVGRVMLGLTVATLIGAPLATSIGQGLGWRTAFALVGAIGALTVALVALFVPHDPADVEASPMRELGAFRRPQVWLALGVGAIGSGGLFAIFSYITPTLTEVAGVPLHLVPFALCAFGAGMIAGNIVGGWLADRALMPTIGGGLIWNGAMMGLFYFTSGHAVLAVINVFLIGTAFVLVPGVQTRLMDVAGDAQTLAAALNHSAFNIANALGAYVGGLAISAGYGWRSTSLVGVGFALAGFAIFCVSLALDAARRSATRRPRLRMPSEQES